MKQGHFFPIACFSTPTVPQLYYLWDTKQRGGPHEDKAEQKKMKM